MENIEEHDSRIAAYEHDRVLGSVINQLVTFVMGQVRQIESRGLKRDCIALLRSAAETLEADNG